MAGGAIVADVKAELAETRRKMRAGTRGGERSALRAQANGFVNRGELFGLNWICDYALIALITGEGAAKGSRR